MQNQKEACRLQNKQYQTIIVRMGVYGIATNLKPTQVNYPDIVIQFQETERPLYEEVREL